MALKSINPYTNRLIREHEEYGEPEIRLCLERSEETGDTWKRTTFAARKKLMLQVADLLMRDRERLAKVITDEMGKIIAEARSEIEKCAWVCNYYASEAENFLQTEAVATGAYRSYVSYDPLGTILGIMPWNFPFWQVFRFAAPTLMAGNTILLKHASNVQLCAQAIVDTFRLAGFGDNVIQNLPVSSVKINAIIENPVVKAITLTGSEKAGMKVGRSAGCNIKKTVLELGGSNAFIVLEDADIAKAVETGLRSRMQNSGQSCIAAKRFIVHKKIYNDFVKLFAEGLKEYMPGDPMDPNTRMGPLANIKQADILKDQVKRSVDSGAKIMTGGYPARALYPPTLLTEVKPGMPVYDEEVFGPVAPIIAASDTEEAIALANRSVYGLGVSLFTNNMEKALSLVPEFDDGAVFINAMVKSDPRLPFGGTKRSGYGRELSANGIREFVNIKTVYMDRFDRDKTL